MLYSKSGMWIKVQEWSFTQIHFSLTSFQFSSCTGMSPGGGYRVDYTWYHFISSSSQALGRGARISMGSWAHQLSYCLSFSLLKMETAISCMLPVWERCQIYDFSSKKDVREFYEPKSSGCKCPFLASLSRMQYKSIYLQKESISAQAKELSSKTHYGLIGASCSSDSSTPFWISSSLLFFVLSAEFRRVVVKKLCQDCRLFGLGFFVAAY